MNLRHQFRKAFWKTGLDVVRFKHAFHPVWQRRRLLELKRISLVLDVGANTGGFATHMRGDVGWRGPMVSFEPLSDAFAALRRAAAGDAQWRQAQIALGDRDEEAVINVAGNSQSSSLLEMLPAHAAAAPTACYQGREKISVRRLDSVFHEYGRENDSVYLKIDTQGFESRVLAGVGKHLQQIAVLQLELSVVPLYQGEMVATEMIAHLQSLGFVLSNLEPVFKDRRSEALLQVDGLFFRG